MRTNDHSEEPRSDRPSAPVRRTRRSPHEPPPPIPAADYERVAKLLHEAEWVFAKTMPDNPHHYTLRRKWANDVDFIWTVELIRRHGRREKYGKNYYKVLDVLRHFYWTMGWPVNYRDGSPCTILINRKPIARRVDAGKGGASQFGEEEKATKIVAS